MKIYQTRALVAFLLTMVIAGGEAEAGSKIVDGHASSSRAFEAVDMADPTVLSSHLKDIRDKIDENRPILKAVENKDIVVFLGNTGVGKSTLINIVCGVSLKIDDNAGNIYVDRDVPGSDEAAVVGGGFTSVTKAPFLISSPSLGLMVDLPGFNDTEGSVDEVLNLSVIRGILTSARSVRAAFVTSEDELTAGRGDLFKFLFKTIRMFQNADFRRHSTLMIINNASKKMVRNHAAAELQEFSEYLSRTGAPQEDSDVLRDLIEREAICLVSRADEGEGDFLDNTRKSLVGALRGLRGDRVTGDELSLQIGMKGSTEGTIHKLYMENMTEEIDMEMSAQRGKDLPKEEKHWKRIDERFRGADIYTLLYPLTQGVYEKAYVLSRDYYRRERSSHDLNRARERSEAAARNARKEAAHAEEMKRQACTELEAARRAAAGQMRILNVLSAETKKLKEEAEQASVDKERALKALAEKEKDLARARQDYEKGNNLIAAKEQEIRAHQRAKEETERRLYAIQHELEEALQTMNRASAEYDRRVEDIRRSHQSQVENLQMDIARFRGCIEEVRRLRQMYQDIVRRADEYRRRYGR